jgi:hypothetical protein
MSIVFVIVLIVGAYALSLALVPFLLAWTGYAKTAFALGIATASALTVDYLYNWPDMTYPHWALGGLTGFYPFTIFGAGAGVAIGFWAWADRWGG